MEFSMNKRALSLMLAFSVGISQIVPAVEVYAEDFSAEVSLVPSSTNVEKGDTFTLKVNVDEITPDSDGNGASGGVTLVSYNSSAFTRYSRLSC